MQATPSTWRMLADSGWQGDHSLKMLCGGEAFPHGLAAFPFLGLLEDVVVSGTEGVAKPDPAVFAIVRQRTGLPLDRLVFVDDRPDNVAAAAATGMDALVFTDAARLRADLRERGLPV